MFLAGLAEKKKKQEKKNGYEAMGMSLGMCFGAAVGTIFPEYIGVTLSMGMLVGLLVGMCVKNCEEDTNEFLQKGGLEGSRMGSLLKSTRNTRALPTGTLRYIRSDYPGNLSDEEVSWLRKNGVTTIIDLREKTEYAQKPCRLETESGFTYYHLPVTGGRSRTRISGLCCRCLYQDDRWTDGADYLRHFEGGKQCAVFLRRGKRQNRRGFRDPAETARIQRQRDHRGLHENEGQPVGLPESVRCGASGGKHSYHSPKRGEYKKGFGCPFPNRGESAKRFYR